jgi:hypothetical protein
LNNLAFTGKPALDGDLPFGPGLGRYRRIVEILQGMYGSQLGRVRE